MALSEGNIAIKRELRTKGGTPRQKFATRDARHERVRHRHR
jgi:hypothetical protein